jgi:hypothetical protein
VPDSQQPDMVNNQEVDPTHSQVSSMAKHALKSK